MNWLVVIAAILGFVLGWLSNKAYHDRERLIKYIKNVYDWEKQDHEKENRK